MAATAYRTERPEIMYTHTLTHTLAVWSGVGRARFNLLPARKNRRPRRKTGRRVERERKRARGHERDPRAREKELAGLRTESGASERASETAACRERDGRSGGKTRA